MTELYSYQRDALAKMKNGCILCGEGGTGKSITGLSYYIQQLEKTPGMPLYIITTAKKRDDGDWDEEWKAFKEKYIDIPVTVDSWNNIQKYKEVKNAFFIFDEQRVSGKGAWVKAFLRISRSNQWILLSATPGDTWSDYIPVFVANGYFQNPSQFLREHAVFNHFSKYPKIDKYVSVRKLMRIRDDILVPMLNNKHTVPHHMPVTVDYDSDIYKSVVKNRWNPWENCPIVNASEYCYCLRKVCNSDRSRMAAVRDICTTHPKVIIFYNFDYELELLKEGFADSGYSVAEWNGHRHEPIPNVDKWIYLVQYAAGAEGWNCVITDTIIFFSQNYSYKATMQASWRIDRVNTPFTDLYFYHLRSNAPIDLAIREALKQKKTFNESAFLENYRIFNEKKKQVNELK